MGDIFLRKYGVETIIPFSLYKLDGTGLKVDAASASGDITVIIDEAAETSLTADAFVDEGSSYSITLSAAELQCKHVIVHVVDQTSPQAWLDKTLTVETYGNASAQHIFDLGTATQSVNVTEIGGVAQSATDLKDLADTGYDPATHKVQGVVLCDTTTTNSDMVSSATIEAACDASLDNAIGGAPTAGSVAERVKALDDLIADSKLPAQIKGTDNIDFAALQKTSLNAATPAVTVSDKTGFSLSAAGIDAFFDETLTAHATADSLGLAVKNTLKIKKNKQAIVGTQLIIYDDDGSTPLYTFDLDSATAPTSRTPA
jgi:hypothetical protein